MTRTVVFAQRHIVHFRVPFYQNLRGALDMHGVRVRVLVGEATKTDAGRLTWSKHGPTSFHFKGMFCWGRKRLGQMQRRCLLKALTHCIEAVVDNMRRGVLAAMEMPFDDHRPAHRISF